MKNVTRIAFGTALAFGLAAGSAAPTFAQEQVPVVAAEEVVIELNGEAEGSAVLRGDGEQTEITIELAGAPAGVTLEGYLVSGSCGADGETVARLGSIETDGEGAAQLNAVLPLPLEAITSGEVTVEVRPEGEVPAVACGTHTPETAPEHEHEPAPTPEPLPEETPEEPQEQPVPPAARR